jgi:hypothetical protein
VELEGREGHSRDDNAAIILQYLQLAGRRP